MTTLLTLALLAPTFGPPCDKVDCRVMLVQPSPHGKKCPPIHMDYHPQAGDIFIFQHKNPLIHCMYTAVLCGGATHVGVAVPRPDGSIGMLEAPLWHPAVLSDIPSRIQGYGGELYVRQRKTPASPEECARLTQFACCQEGKGYSPYGLMVPPFTLPVRVFTRGKVKESDTNPRWWICSSLVGAALAYAGLVDPGLIRPQYTCASDYATDRLLDLSGGWEKPVLLTHDGGKRDFWWVITCRGELVEWKPWPHSAKKFETCPR